MVSKIGLNKGQAYYFDYVYALCDYKTHETDCNCNNGYTCTHKDCSEACEDGENLGKCYIFTCPLVSIGASREAIAATGDIYDEDVTYNKEGYTEDYNEIVTWIGEGDE